MLIIERGRGDGFAFKELQCGGETELVGPSKGGDHVSSPAYCHPVKACAQHGQDVSFSSSVESVDFYVKSSKI